MPFVHVLWNVDALALLIYEESRRSFQLKRPDESNTAANRIQTSGAVDLRLGR